MDIHFTLVSSSSVFTFGCYAPFDEDLSSLDGKRLSKKREDSHIARSEAESWKQMIKGLGV